VGLRAARRENLSSERDIEIDPFLEEKSYPRAKAQNLPGV